MESKAVRMFRFGLNILFGIKKIFGYLFDCEYYLNLNMYLFFLNKKRSLMSDFNKMNIMERAKSTALKPKP